METPFVFREDVLKGKAAFITGGAADLGFGMVPACAAKARVDALTRTLAVEWGRFRIRSRIPSPCPPHMTAVSSRCGTLPSRHNLCPQIRRILAPEERAPV